MEIDISCPIPLVHDTVQLAHGGGGRVMRDLLERMVLPAFDNAALLNRHDAGVISVGRERIAFSTDTFVVSPRRFPGGDIGKLAVIGTVNDLAMAGAKPLALSCALVIEEGFSLKELSDVLQSMKATAEACGVAIITGDTKVVDKGKGDGLFINTSGIGLVPANINIGPNHVQPGDAILLSGDVGRHGVAVMSVREGLAFRSPIQSDCAPLHGLAEALVCGGVAVRCMRDPTRGGLATVLNEIALDRGLAIEVQEDAIPVHDAVASACELLGLDPLYVACEGRMVAVVREAQADQALALMRKRPEGKDAVRIGHVVSAPMGTVTLRTRLGTHRVLDMLSGEQLPRIC